MNNHYTLEQFLNWVRKNVKEGKCGFWDCLNKDVPKEWSDSVYMWRDSIQENTTKHGKWGDNRVILNKYNEGCRLFGKDEFEKDVTQFYNDNID